MLNKKASIADLGVVAFTIIVLAMVITGNVQDDDNVEQIGKYQNELLDSYTVAEGARSYLEKSVEYSTLSATDELCNLDKTEFRTAFDLYIENMPERNMGLTIEKPIEVLDPYDLDLNGNMVSIDFQKPLIVTNAGSQNFKKFQIRTELNPNITYTFDCDVLTQLKERFGFSDLVVAI